MPMICCPGKGEQWDHCHVGDANREPPTFAASKVTKTSRVHSQRISFGLFKLLVFAIVILLAAGESSKCDEDDPNLQEMVYDLGDGEQTAMVYVDPDVTSYYKLTDPPSKTKVRPQFNGFQGKFINLSARTVSLYWEDREGGRMHLMRQHKGFTVSAFQNTSITSNDTAHFSDIFHFSDSLREQPPFRITASTLRKAMIRPRN